jgi:hypothetical protein
LAQRLLIILRALGPKTPFLLMHKGSNADNTRKAPVAPKAKNAIPNLPLVSAFILVLLHLVLLLLPSSSSSSFSSFLFFFGGDTQLNRLHFQSSHENTKQCKPT